jgi:HEAT repeat protein
MAAIRALGARRCEAALEALVDHLARTADRDDEHDDEETRCIANAIAAMADPSDGGAHLARAAVTLLAGRLHSEREAFRRAAANALGRIGRASDADVLGLLMADADPAVRRAAVEALARLQGPELPEPLHLALADEAATVRVAATAALAASADPRSLDDLERLGRDEDPHVRAAVMRAAGAKRLGDDAPPESASRRLALLRAGAGDQAIVAVAALEGLRSVGGEDAAEAAAPLLNRPEIELVRAAIACVGRHGDLEAQKELFALVAHPDWSVRAEAVRVLAERRVSHAVPAILRRLETEQDEFVRDAMLQALAKLEH